MDTKRSRAAQDDRRRTAVRKVAGGRTCTDVADLPGLHVETVRRWVRTHEAGGDAGLARTPHPGRRPSLTPAQQAEALNWLTRRPTEFGSRTDPWTAARVAQLVRERFGVAYHPGDPREWLTTRRHPPQKPARRARRRDPVAIDRGPAAGYPAAPKKPPPATPASS